MTALEIFKEQATFGHYILTKWELFNLTRHVISSLNTV